MSNKKEKSKSIVDEVKITDEEPPVKKEVDENEKFDSSEDIQDHKDEIVLELEQKVDDLKDQLMRSLADGENLRKRTQKDVEHAKKYSHISFIKELVSSVDNLQRALQSIPEDTSSLPEPIKNLIVGLEIVEKEVISTLEKHNVKQINPLGEKFDYNFHQAMFEVVTNESDPGTVVEVSQKGYLLHDRLVRPAMVGIAKKIDAEDTEKKTDKEQ
ncbi:MAG: nucleotide exchange factor GrpE [Alphaproteobacteria bacterium]|nr:nucleotide exchange factor GrpE [Alphaproteobacteria bacterium]